MKRWLRNNGLSLVFIIIFLASWIGQVIMGEKVYNDDMRQKGGREVTLSEYLFTGHFFESTFENWESEFLQMGLFVLLTAFFYQKGSSESKDPDKKESGSRKKVLYRKNAPWPVKKGGWILKIYEHSLSIAFGLLFLFSFLLHFYGSLKNYNLDQKLLNLPTQDAFHYLFNSKLWFESFQNWQSEFLSVFAMIFLGIYLREKNSTQSKEIYDPHEKTGD